jgi:hypothetical protein
MFVGERNVPSTQDGGDCRRQLLCVIAGALLVTVAIGVIAYVLSFQAFYPHGVPAFRTYWGLPFGWLRTTILAPPPSTPTSITVYGMDFVFFVLDVLFWTMVLAPLTLFRRGLSGRA